MTKKTEYEKMLAAEPYCGIDADLLKLQQQGQAKLKAYRAINEDDEQARHAALGEVFGSIGERSKIIEPFYIDFGCHVHLGSGFINVGATFLDGNTITIGDMTLVGPHVQFLSTSHPVEPEKRIPDNIMDFLTGKIGPEGVSTNIAKPIVIGEKCWIGGGVIIMGGVTIGDGTTIGAGSVVTKDIPARCVAVGNPARVLRFIDDDA